MHRTPKIEIQTIQRIQRMLSSFIGCLLLLGIRRHWMRECDDAWFKIQKNSNNTRSTFGWGLNKHRRDCLIDVPCFAACLSPSILSLHGKPSDTICEGNEFSQVIHTENKRSYSHSQHKCCNITRPSIMEFFPNVYFNSFSMDSQCAHGDWHNGWRRYILRMYLELWWAMHGKKADSTMWQSHDNRPTK